MMVLWNSYYVPVHDCMSTHGSAVEFFFSVLKIALQVATLTLYAVIHPTFASSVTLFVYCYTICIECYYIALLFLLSDDLNRVVLRQGWSLDSDYINASFIDVMNIPLYASRPEKATPSRCIQDYKQRRAYIATQGPLSGTVDDLWRIMWEYKCSCIFMLCDMTENDKVLSQHPSSLCIMRVFVVCAYSY